MTLSHFVLHTSESQDKEIWHRSKLMEYGNNNNNNKRRKSKGHSGKFIVGILCLRAVCPFQSARR